MAFIGGMFERHSIRDTRGTTDNVVAGFGNTVDFRGDKGANSFTVMGGAHNVTVNNLGRDDQVNLRGPGWQELPDANSRDGVVRYYNQLNGSFAEVRTDGGRDDNFVRARVQGANCSSSRGSWDQLGQMSYGSAMYEMGRRDGFAQGYGAGSYDGFRAGRVQGHMDVGNWFAMAALGPFAWSCF